MLQRWRERSRRPGLPLGGRAYLLTNMSEIRSEGLSLVDGSGQSVSGKTPSISAVWWSSGSRCCSSGGQSCARISARTLCSSNRPTRVRAGQRLFQTGEQVSQPAHLAGGRIVRLQQIQLELRLAVDRVALLHCRLEQRRCQRGDGGTDRGGYDAAEDRAARGCVCMCHSAARGRTHGAQKPRAEAAVVDAHLPRALLRGGAAAQPAAWHWLWHPCSAGGAGSAGPHEQQRRQAGLSHAVAGGSRYTVGLPRGGRRPLLRAPLLGPWPHRTQRSRAAFWPCRPSSAAAAGHAWTTSEPFYFNHENYHCQREVGIEQTHHLYKGRP